MHFVIRYKYFMMLLQMRLYTQNQELANGITRIQQPEHNTW